MNERQVGFFETTWRRHGGTAARDASEIAEDPRVRRVLLVDVRVALRAVVRLEFVVEGVGIGGRQENAARARRRSVTTTDGAIALGPREQVVNLKPGRGAKGGIGLLRDVRTTGFLNTWTARGAVRTVVFLVVGDEVFGAGLVTDADQIATGHGNDD